jgi:predicted outer membrane lipoprotein
MRWLYLTLGVLAAGFAVLTALFEEPSERAEGVKVCITASVVNLGLYFAITWAKAQRKKSPSKDR